jgi:SAM-dependent methyltransferase
MFGADTLNLASFGQAPGHGMMTRLEFYRGVIPGMHGIAAAEQEVKVDPRSHWAEVYRTKGPDQMSWFQSEATLSLELIQQVSPDCDSAIIDAGAGASTLVDGLLAAGYSRITVLDLSADALARSQHRLVHAASSVVWLNADVLTAELPSAAFDVWHDRAVFHFLTAVADRARYVAQVRHAVRPGGYVLVATFAEDGPTRCSGLDVARYSPDALHAEFGGDFKLVEHRREEHATPSGARQAFSYCLCRYGSGENPERQTG